MCVRVFTCVCLHVCVYMCVFTCVCLHVCVYMCVFTCVCLHVCVYMCVFTCVCLHGGLPWVACHVHVVCHVNSAMFTWYGGLY